MTSGDREVVGRLLERKQALACDCRQIPTSTACPVSTIIMRSPHDSVAHFFGCRNVIFVGTGEVSGETWADRFTRLVQIEQSLRLHFGGQRLADPNAANLADRLRRISAESLRLPQTWRDRWPAHLKTNRGEQQWWQRPLKHLAHPANDSRQTGSHPRYQYMSCLPNLRLGQTSLLYSLRLRTYSGDLTIRHVGRERQRISADEGERREHPKQCSSRFCIRYPD